MAIRLLHNHGESLHNSHIIKQPVHLNAFIVWLIIKFI